IDIAISKAWTAACTRRGTHEYAEIAGPGKPAFGIHVSNGGRFMIVRGGLPLVLGGVVVGGVGCSSGPGAPGPHAAPAPPRAAAPGGLRALVAGTEHRPRRA